MASITVVNRGVPLISMIFEGYDSVTRSAKIRNPWPFSQSMAQKNWIFQVTVRPQKFKDKGRKQLIASINGQKHCQVHVTTLH